MLFLKLATTMNARVFHLPLLCHVNFLTSIILYVLYPTQKSVVVLNSSYQYISRDMQ